MNEIIKRRINGPTVRALRDALGIRHMDLAARVGVSKGTLTHVETGARAVAPATLRKFAEALGVSVEAISYPVSVPARGHKTETKPKTARAATRA